MVGSEDGQGEGCGRQGGAECLPGPLSGCWVVEGSPGRRLGWLEPEGWGEAMGPGRRGLQGHSTQDPEQLLTLSRRICTQGCDKIRFAI